MSIQAWQVAFLNPVKLRSDNFYQLITRMQNLGYATIPCHLHATNFGQCVWGITYEDQMLAIAWDWQEVRNGVFALSDPMCIFTNIDLLHLDTQAMRPADRLIHLNNAIRAIPWQHDVMCALHPQEERLLA